MVTHKIKSAFRNVTVEPVIFLYFLAIYLLFSVFQPTVFNRVCTTYLRDLNSSTLPVEVCYGNQIYTINTNQSADARDHINKATNSWIKITTIANTLPSILMDCFMGGWSDIFGRKMPMYLPSFGGVLGNIVYILFVSFESMDVSWLCLASFLTGIFGGVTSVIANCLSYVACFTEGEQRTLRVSVVEAMWFLSATCGPFLSKALKDSLGTVYVFAICVLCHAAVIVYSFFLKEPDVSRERKNVTLRNLFSIHHLIDSFKTVLKIRENKGRTVLILLLLSLFINSNVGAGESDILYIFMANTHTNHVFEYFYGFKNFMWAFGLLIILPILKQLKIDDLHICILALVSSISGMVMLAFSTNLTLLFLSCAVGMGAKTLDSVLRSLISQNVKEEEIGKIYGIVAVGGDSALILGALIFNSLFTPLLSITGFPGMTYVVGSIILLLPLLMLTSLAICKKCYNPISDNDKSKHVYSNDGYQN